MAQMIGKSIVMYVGGSGNGTALETQSRKRPKMPYICIILKMDTSLHNWISNFIQVNLRRKFLFVHIHCLGYLIKLLPFYIKYIDLYLTDSY